jgi:hypothetical protein
LECAYRYGNDIARATQTAHHLVLDMLLEMYEVTIGDAVMMNPRFRVGYVWTLCLVLSFLCGTSAMGAQPDKEIDRLAKAYRAARTEFERRAVCLDAIDGGVIAEGRSVTVVDAIFGTTYATKLPRVGAGLDAGVVRFHPLPPPPSSGRHIQAATTGWFFVFEFDSAGKVENYYLSNLHK